MRLRACFSRELIYKFWLEKREDLVFFLNVLIFR